MEFSGIFPGKASSIARVLDAERWALAEEKTAELITRLQPTLSAEVYRHAVAKYVQQLIESRFPCQVCRYGSMPFKTYLPDGDIDLTACGKGEVRLCSDVFDMLKVEEENEDTEFHIKDVDLISGNVTVIKCTVGDVAVDISFNKLNGLCALCFLDEIDGLVKQNHLFKQSIILVKAWCYYESRVLGSAHSLLSTYALEILVLYIFHVFNNSFAGPLEVLYRFLEFFSNFMWDKFCLSLWGPIPVESKTIGSAEPPRTDAGTLFLSKDFIDSCRKKYGVYAHDQEGEDRLFLRRTPFNIVDPLSIQNNLGRSVSIGSSFRIPGAFAYGAQNLARLLQCPKLDLINVLNEFFANTLERLGNGYHLHAPHLSIQPLQLSNSSSHEASDNSRSVSSIWKDNDGYENLDSREHLDKLEPHPSSSDLRSSIPTEEHSSYILDSDIANYRQSLQYSQFFQHPHYRRSFIYPNSVVRPVYEQRYFLWDGRRPLLASASLLPQGTTNVLPHFGSEIPRYGSETEAYSPNPNLSFSGQQASSSNHQRANQNYVQIDDRPATEGSCINSKSRRARRR